MSRFGRFRRDRPGEMPRRSWRTSYFDDATGAGRWARFRNRYTRYRNVPGSGGFTRALRGGVNFFSKPKVAIPALLGIAAIGFVSGFTKEVTRHPTTNAFISDYLAVTEDETRGAPLGINSKNYIYRPSGSDLGATGELALALFHTRHGR